MFSVIFTLSAKRNIKMNSRKFCLSFLLIAAVFIGYTRAHTQDYFSAAVFEHSRQLDDTNSTPAAVLQSNLQYYARAAKLAKEQGANIIVYPEYGIFPPEERDVLKNYLEFIPNPKETFTTPCDEIELFLERPILRKLSCMAKNNEIVVIANMGGREPCAGESDCPEDGELQFNANVAFDQNGTLIARYYKEHLFFESGMDVPREEQDPTVETNLGKFAMFICFDIIFKKIADFARMDDIEAILFSTMWHNSSPLYTSIQWWQAWAMGNNATLLASNIQIPGYSAAGSGIYRGREGSIASTLNPDGISKLIVATVPKRNKQILSTAKIIAITENGTEDWKDDGKDLPTVCSYGILGESQDIYKDYRCLNEDVSNYTLVKLTENEGHLEVCHEGFCCELDYSASNMNESFYFGVYNGTHNALNRYFWSEENCFLARCEDFNGTACSNFLMHSETSFHRTFMTAHFTTNYIYPSVMSSSMRLVPVNDWTYRTTSKRASIEFNSSSGIQLLVATLKGRAYDRDPPYVR